MSKTVVLGYSNTSLDNFRLYRLTLPQDDFVMVVAVQSVIAEFIEVAVKTLVLYVPGITLIRAASSK